MRKAVDDMQPNKRRNRTTWTLALVLLVGLASGAGAGAVSCQVGPLCSQDTEPVVERDPEPAADVRGVAEPATGVSVVLPRTWVESRGVNGTAYFDPDASTDGTIEGATVGIEIAVEPGPSSDLEKWSERRGEQFVGYVFLQRGYASLGGELAWRHDYVADVGDRRLSVVEYAVARGGDVLRVSTFRLAGNLRPVGNLAAIVDTVDVVGAQ